jgi:hypothetical protein
MPPPSPRSPRTPPDRDWPLIWVLTSVSIILFFELVVAIAWIRILHLRSQARWRRLRERGVVIVSGPALVWVQDLPVQRQVSYLNLRERVERDRRESERKKSEEKAEEKHDDGNEGDEVKDNHNNLADGHDEVQTD